MMDFRDDLPDPTHMDTPQKSLDAILDVAAEVGKVRAEECVLMDGMALGVAYAALYQFVRDVKNRRGK